MENGLEHVLLSLDPAYSARRRRCGAAAAVQPAKTAILNSSDCHFLCSLSECFFEVLYLSMDQNLSRRSLPPHLCGMPNFVKSFVPAL